ncbi:IclR family transcriptional regulator [Shimazuella kribbensis]|uniref:IclR family transcriptional regulator n=1 Tax=Shimazuella kribbensis TaxID=139808 RepID=UPI00041805CA|nr:IclR family transcriptional regulator [Shimazuella kribbensis]
MSLKTLENSLRLLEFFTRDTPVWGVRELAKECGMSHSVVQRILSTFEKKGFLMKDAQSQKYELGISFWEYGQMVQEKIHLDDLIHPIMETISHKAGESICFTILDGNEGVCIDIVESSQIIKYAISVGSRTQLYAGASNKVMMAYLPEAQQEEIINQGLIPVTSNTIIHAEKLKKDLNEIRQNGWCYSVGEYTESVFGIAIPLFNYRNEVFASLTISGPAYRVNEDEVKNLLELLQTESKKIQDYFYRLRISKI